MARERPDGGREGGPAVPLPPVASPGAESEIIRLDQARRERKRRELASRADPTSGNSRQSWFALAFLVVLCGLGFWLYKELSTSLRVEQCVEAGFRNCAERAAR